MQQKSIGIYAFTTYGWGTSKYESDDVYLMEYTFKGMVMNGSIFSWWGLYDYVLVSKDEGIYKKIMEKLSKR